MDSLAYRWLQRTVLVAGINKSEYPQHYAQNAASYIDLDELGINASRYCHYLLGFLPIS